MSKTRLTKSCVLLVSASVLGAVSSRQGRADETDGPTTTEKAPTKDTSPSGKFAEEIDAYLEKRMDEGGDDPPRPSDDAEFLRRVYVDICGTTPTPSETMSFLADRGPDKRKRKVDELIVKPDCAREWAEYWTDVMDGEATTKKREDQIKTNLRSWFEDELKNNVAFDEITRRLVSAEGYVQNNGATGYMLSYTDMGNQPDPKQLAATTARVFMGLQIECAQCHNHPFADWKRDDFMGFAAFFSRARRDQERMKPPFTKKELEALPADQRAKIRQEFQKKQNQAPFGVKEEDKGEFMAEVQTVRNPGDPIKPAAAGATKAAPSPTPAPAARGSADRPEEGEEEGRSQGRRHPEVSRHAALHRPGPGDVDHRRDQAPRASRQAHHRRQEPLLREVLRQPPVGSPHGSPARRADRGHVGRERAARPRAAEPAGQGLQAPPLQPPRHDPRDLPHGRLRAQLAVDGRHDGQGGVRQAREGRAALRAGSRPPDRRPPAGSRRRPGRRSSGEQSLDDNARRQQEGLLRRFERLFGESNLDPKKYEETIPQALFLMNGQGTNRAGRANGGGKKKGDVRGAMLTEDPRDAMGKLMVRYDDPRERVTRIYLAALARPPRKVELEDALAFVKADDQDLYEDLLWALVNSAEFRFNR